jgi:hypothetical protein
MLDQYGNNVPDDLVLMPIFSWLTDEEVNLVFDADWYECDKLLFVSAWEIDYLSEASIGEIVKNINKITKVNDCLKRGNEDDGFYHA